jgi:hypothetical protein
LAQEEADPAGYFTLRKVIWKTEDDDGQSLGFTVATEKRGGSIKFGPSLIAVEHRNRGVGQALRLAVENYYRKRGFRKAYSTTSINNYPGIYYLVGVGYSIEAHCRSHYQQGVDELVLGKLLRKTRILSTSVSDSSVLLQRLTPYYDELDQSFEESIFRASAVVASLQDESFYTAKRKILFGEPENNFCVTTPKRQGWSSWGLCWRPIYAD